MKKLSKLIFCLLLMGTVGSKAGELTGSVGNFDYSDKGKSASMFDLTYAFTDSNVESPIGVIKPIMGTFFTQDSAVMAYAGAKIDYKLGMFVITPSFTPGFYSKGDGKDLGNVLEFKSQVNIGLDLGKDSILAVGYNHVSNASLGDKNPGANSYSFNFSKQF